MVDALVSPHINLLSNMLFEELPSQAPIRELNVKETDDKNVAADMFEERTASATLISFFSAWIQKKIYIYVNKFSK